MERTIIIIVILITMSSCASLFSPRKHSVNFTSSPTKAKVFINNEEKGITPLNIKLKPTKVTYSIKYIKEGYKPKNTKLSTSVGRAWVFLNLFTPYFSGVLIDAITGSWRKFDRYVIHQNLEKISKDSNHELRKNNKEAEEVEIPEISKKKNELKINFLLYLTMFNDKYRFYSIDYQRILNSTNAIGFSFGGRFNFKSIWEASYDFPSFPDLPDIAFMPYYRSYHYSSLKASGAFTEVNGLLTYYKHRYFLDDIDKGIRKNLGLGIGAAIGYKHVEKNGLVVEFILGGGFNTQYIFHPRIGILIGKRF